MLSSLGNARRISHQHAGLGHCSPPGVRPSDARRCAQPQGRGRGSACSSRGRRHASWRCWHRAHLARPLCRQRFLSGHGASGCTPPRGRCASSLRCFTLHVGPSQAASQRHLLQRPRRWHQNPRRAVAGGIRGAHVPVPWRVLLRNRRWRPLCVVRGDLPKRLWLKHAAVRGHVHSTLRRPTTHATTCPSRPKHHRRPGTRTTGPEGRSVPRWHSTGVLDEVGHGQQC